MGIVDRTPEFQLILVDLQGKGMGPGKNDVSGSPPPQAMTEFNAWSADIGSGIHQASLKVQELRKMARQKGIFDDKTFEIQNLTCSVKEGIQMLDQKIGALEKKVNGTGPNRNYQAHTKNLVTTLKTRLGEVTKDFRDALEDRTKALEQQDKRRQIYTPGAGAGKSLFPSRQRAHPSGNADDLEGFGGVQGMAFQTQFHSSRAESVQNVQKTIGELAQMFKKMAGLVAAQGEMIQRIDEQTDDTRHNVEAGQEHLLKYFKYISSNRTLIMKVLAILIFFVIFFVVFLA